MNYIWKANLVILTALTIFSSCSKEEKKEEVIRPVRFQTVAEAGGQMTRIFSGVAQPGFETKLSFKVSGTIQQFDAKVGQQLKAGELIAAIDASDYRLYLEDARATVKNADAVEDNAERNFERFTLLYENNNASLSDYEAAQSAYESAKASEKSAKQRRKLAELQVSYTKLYAPVNGVIADVFVEKNENVQAGQRIVVLNSDSDIEVNVAIPELYISRVKVGNKVKIIFTVISDKEYSGIVSEVSFTTGRAQTTYPVIIKITDPDDQIRPGMAVDVFFKFIYEEFEDKMIVSAFAVSEDVEGKFVFVINPDQSAPEFGSIEKRSVTIGQLTNDGIEILTGLKEGDRVVTAGVSKITDGMKVKILQ
ncbi:MAG: efflux RND transporter periplasmic adaptor subunit [Bacteroidetes bacterium]|nr:efflux RND transporter periplasmic adaptor subunit [Bacteroidota bacterium]